ncbi:MAG: lysophospholipid acyltransferase family protein [Pseudomonadota bacterium]
MRILVPLVAQSITGAKARWQGCKPELRQRVYFANHGSHGDFLLIWSALPEALRPMTWPVVGADYWNKGGVRRFLIRNVFRAVTVERESQGERRVALEHLNEALDENGSLILFPEGTRNTSDTQLLPFKSGLYHLAVANPHVEFVPVWIENIRRVLPKGDILPVPLLCSVTFGEPISVGEAEKKSDFLERAQNAVVALAPRDGKESTP